MLTGALFVAPESFSQGICMSSLKQKFGMRLQEIRKSKGFTQEKLAEKIGVDTPHISNIERGKYFVSAETLENLANALNVQPKDLFEFGHIKKRDEIVRAISHYAQNCSDSKIEFLSKIITSIEEMNTA